MALSHPLERLESRAFGVSKLTRHATFLAEITAMQQFLRDLLFRESATCCVQRPRHICTMKVAGVARIVVKLDKRLDRGLGLHNRVTYRRLSPFRQSLDQCGDFIQELGGGAIDSAGALAQFHEGRQAVGQASLELLIRESGEASEVPPVGA